MERARASFWHGISFPLETRAPSSQGICLRRSSRSSGSALTKPQGAAGVPRKLRDGACGGSSSDSDMQSSDMGGSDMGGGWQGVGGIQGGAQRARRSGA